MQDSWFLASRNDVDFLAIYWPSWLDASVSGEGTMVPYVVDVGVL